MPDPFVTKMRAVAKRILTKYGQVVAITKITENSYDPETSEATQTTEMISGIGVVLEWSYDSQTIGGTGQVLTSLIEVTDKRLILFLDSGFISLDDKITANGILYTVKEPLKEINPSNSVIIYDCNLRV